MQVIEMNIGKIIRTRRQELKLTQVKLAEYSDVSVRMLKAIESGEANPSLKTTEKILTVLGLRLNVESAD